MQWRTLQPTRGTRKVSYRLITDYRTWYNLETAKTWSLLSGIATAEMTVRAVITHASAVPIRKETRRQRATLIGVSWQWTKTWNHDGSMYLEGSSVGWTKAISGIIRKIMKNETARRTIPEHFSPLAHSCLKPMVMEYTNPKFRILRERKVRRSPTERNIPDV